MYTRMNKKTNRVARQGEGSSTFELWAPFTGSKDNMVCKVSEKVHYSYHVEPDKIIGKLSVEHIYIKYNLYMEKGQLICYTVLYKSRVWHF